VHGAFTDNSCSNSVSYLDPRFCCKTGLQVFFCSLGNACAAVPKDAVAANAIDDDDVEVVEVGTTASTRPEVNAIDDDDVEGVDEEGIMESARPAVNASDDDDVEAVDEVGIMESTRPDCRSAIDTRKKVSVR
jgi:hypothetical protein